MSAAAEVLALVRQRGALSTAAIREGLALGGDELLEALASLRARNRVVIEATENLGRVIVMPLREES